MIQTAATIALVMVGLAIVLTLVRLVRGPDATDRVLALDTLVINAIALVMLQSIVLGTKLIFEAALLFAMVGFVSTVAFCRFMLRGDVIE